jgi:glycosyltransferase involved in cell wall biosynthesis
LDGTLRSFFARCQDTDRCQIKVLYRASAEYQSLYDVLIREYPLVEFVAEHNFRNDLLNLLSVSEAVLFVVDDNLFIRNFTATEMVEALRVHPQAVGFSMRLGCNTTFCYPLNKMQHLPQFETVAPQILSYDWTRADCDFNYPLEVSSSVYRVADVLPVLREMPFNNPNTLEGEFAARASHFQASHPQLLCFGLSRAFCNPVNLVQKVCQNRAGGEAHHSPERLAQQFRAGVRVDVEAYLNFTPSGCHQEVPLYFRVTPPPSGPAVSVIIPCYKQAHYLPEAVQSVLDQTFTDWEIIIVNDGSPDDTIERVNFLLNTNLGQRIILINQVNQGLAMARNNGIAIATGEYILPLDADDAIDPTFISKAVAVLECSAQVHIVHTGHQTFGHQKRNFVPGEVNFFKLVNANQISYCSLYRREVFEMVGGYNPNMVWGYEDWDFWIGAAKRGFRFQKIDEPLFFYRVKLESMLTNALRRHSHLKARIILNHPELYNRSSWEEAFKVWETVKIEAKSTRPPAFDCPVRVPQSVFFIGSNLISESGSLNKKVPSIAFTAPEIGACDIEILFKHHRWFDCARTCQELLAVHPGNIDAMKVLAESFVNLQDISSALEVYRHASLTNLDDASIRSRIQELESKLGTEAFPTPKQEAAIQRGLAALENDQAAEALKHYRNAQTVGPAYPSLDHVVRELEVRLASAAPKLELQNNRTLGGTDSDSISRPSDQEKRLGPLWSTTAVDSNPARGNLTRPLISVILPTFNRPQLLAECLGGFAAQSLSADQFEVVIVDDGSKPPVRTVSDSFADRLRIRYHYQPNSGLAAARNQAIELASSPWLALHDDDDVPGPNYLQGCVDFHRKNPSETDILLAQVVPSPSLPINPLLEWIFDARNGVIGFPEPGVWHGFTRFYGGTSSCKRALFLHELYDPEYRFGYEDMELAFRLNRKAPLRVEYHPEVFSHLIRSPDFPGTFRRLYREGRSLRRFFQQQGEASFSVIPSEFRNCSEWVSHLEPRIPELMGLIRRLEISGGGQVSITIDGRHLTGNEALKATYSLCARFARGRGWLDFASGLDETRGLDRIKSTLDAYASSGPMGNQATEMPTNLEKPRVKRALAYFHSNLFPPRSGAHRRCLSLLVALRTLGYEVTLVSSDLFTDQPWSDESVTGLAQHCGIQTRIHRGTAADRHFVALRQKAGNFWDMHTPPDLIASFRTAARETRPEVVLVNYAYCSGLTAVPELSDCLRVLEMHDLVSLSSSMAGAAWGQLGQGPYGPDSVSADFLDEQFNRRLRLSVDPEEYRRYSRFDLVTAISNIEADSIRTNAPGSNAVWLPMAHDSVSIDNRYDGSPIFVIFTNPFNIQGQLYFVKKVLPRVLAVIPNFKLRVVGDACRVLKPVPGIELLGFVPDLKSVYADASYAICPLIGGTGMQVKIVEAMAHGIPVIALRNVAGSSPIEHGVNGFIADTAEQFANHVIQLHQDRQFCRRLGQAAREKIAAGFSSKDLAQRLENALTACATARAIRGAALPSSGAAVQPIQNLFLPVRWSAPIFNLSGYASEAINFVLPLEKNCTLGILHNSSIWSEAFTRGLPTSEREALFRMRDRFGTLQGGICIAHGPAGFFNRLPDADYSIGRTMFETDRIAPDWVAACNRMDEVWVPSQFNVETFAASGVERSKLVVMPGAVDSEFFDPARHTVYPLPNPARFNFLSIFEWSSRKGWDVLLAAYLREFSADDDVCLWLRTYLFSKPDGDPTEAIWQRIQEFTASLGLVGKNLPRIELIAEQVPSDQLPGLYLACDCYVAPSRGEGWGRPQHEAMLMERPVIATNWSANTEFMTVDNSYLLDYEVVDTQGLEPELSHYKGHRWANPSESHLRTLMRHVFTHPEEARLKGQGARKHMAWHYNREAVADRVIYRLQHIERSLKQYGLPPAPVTQIHASKSVEEDSLTTLAIDGSFFDLGSLSSVNRALLQALDAEPSIRAGGVSRAAAPIGTALPPEVQWVVRRVFRNAPLTTEITVRHEWPPRWDKPQRGAWVLIQPWEFGSIPAEWAAQSGNVDEIWCPSRYVRSLYLQAGIPTEKLKVLPNGYNPLVHHPNAAPTPIATHKRFKFLFVGGTIARKGADLLLETYLKTFRRSDDVCLVIKDFGGTSAYQGQILSERIRAAQADTAAPEIVYLDQELSEQDLAGLYTACDCLVHPYRGEGFGLPVLEAMACALPVICTGGGATDDFATDEFVHRLPSRRAFIGNSVSGMKLDHRGWWLEPDLEELSGVMREVVLNPQPFKERAKLGAQHVLGNWTWAHSARTMSVLASDLKKRLTNAG